MARSPVRRSSRPPHRARSPRACSPRKSPRRRSPLGRRPASPRRRSPNRGGRRGPRSPPPRRGEGSGPGGGAGPGGIRSKRRRKNRRNRGMRRGGVGGGGGGGGGAGGGGGGGGVNSNLMTGGNTQPILASMRMRMDDYLPPKNRLLRDPRLDARGGAANEPTEKGGAGMEQVVMRARREATRNTKDIFWTKKLLDTEVEMPNRWAHSGFKEMYKEELGYSDVEEEAAANEKTNGSPGAPRAGSRPRDPRDPNNALVPRKPGASSPVNYPRSRSPRDPRRRPGSRSRSPRSPRRSPVRAGQRSPRRSPKRSPKKSPSRRSPRPGPGADRRGRSRTPRSHKRRHSRSRSFSSSSSGSFSSSTGSRSYSRSYSSYSRSSSGSSSSSFTSSSSGSSISPPRGGRHRGRSRGSFTVSPPPRRKGYSGSASPRRGKISKRRPPSASPTQVRMKQITHKETTKKLVTKTVSNVVMTKSSASKKLKTKTKVKDGDALPPIRRKPSRVPPSGDPPPPGYYDDNGPMKPIEGGPAASNYRGPGTPPMGAPPEGGRHLDPHHHRVVPPDHPDYHQPQARRDSTHRSEGEETDSDSTTDEDDRPRKMTLSERFGKLAQLSSQRQEYEGVRMKIVREGGQDKKVYLEGGRLHSRSPSPGRGRGAAHDRWMAEHQTEYADYQERYGEIRQWDPHRDLPSELPTGWDDVNTRFRYYKDSGYFGDRNITLEDYLKWEDWWYRYRDWLEKYGNPQDERRLQLPSYDAYEMHSPGARWGRAASREPDDRKRRRRRGKGKRRKAVVAT